MISVWPDIKTASLRSDNILSGLKLIKSHTTKLLAPTLRPKTSEPPVKQGNYAFRWFETPKDNYGRFYSCARRLRHLLKAALTTSRLNFGGNNRLKKIAYQPFCSPEDPIYQCGRDLKHQKQWKKKPPAKS